MAPLLTAHQPMSLVTEAASLVKNDFHVAAATAICYVVLNVVPFTIQLYIYIHHLVSLQLTGIQSPACGLTR